MGHSWESVWTTGHLRNGFRGLCALCRNLCVWGSRKPTPPPRLQPHTMNQAQGCSTPHLTLDESLEAALLKLKCAKKSPG